MNGHDEEAMARDYRPDHDMPDAALVTAGDGRLWIEMTREAYDEMTALLGDIGYLSGTYSDATADAAQERIDAHLDAIDAIDAAEVADIRLPECPFCGHRVDALPDGRIACDNCQMIWRDAHALARESEISMTFPYSE